MAKIQAVWAIDIGQAALKALKLVPGEAPDRVVAEAFDYVEYPKILSQPDADAEELVREAMATFLERNDLKGSKVAIGVSGQAGLVKFIKLPPVEKKRIPDIVKFEARQQIPFALEEVIWDYQQIGGDDKDGEDDGGFTMAEVGLFAMKRDQINRAILPFKNAGIEVDLVQMGPIALFNSAAFDRAPSPEPAEGEKEKKGDGQAADDEGEVGKAKKAPKGKDEARGSVVLLDIGADNTDLIITDGSRIWQRNVPIGGNHFTRALTKELKLTFAKAEHLKRNATKAPDPRAVFTAMRGVFNDFSSEVNRSIGFYSSVNRGAKIDKIIGLGNGFKLPGLQKFLQQNLSYEVEKLEAFQKLSGEEVLSAPQLQDNLMSFAVAYGLAVQGLGKGPLKTNLLPPEIEQVRMIRRKKPWALVAAALLMIGFASMFFAQFRAYAKVSSEEFKSAVAAANDAKKQGDAFKSAFDSAKESFKAKVTEGENLTGGPGADKTNWPQFLRTVSATLPNPEKELKLDPNVPKNVPVLSKLRVHVDAVLPVYRKDLAAEWFNVETDLPQFAKNTMHALDRKEPPSGEGWVIQIFGHHYNPPRVGVKGMSEQEKAIAFGPTGYLVEYVLPRFWAEPLRLYGISHAALTYLETDDKWTTDKGAQSQMAAFPKLAKAPPPAEGGGAEGGGGGQMEAMMKGGMGMMGGMGPPMGGGGGGGMYSRMGGGMGGMGGGMDMMKSMMGRMGGMGDMMGMGGAGASSKDAPKPEYLNRTNFVIAFVWQPKDPDSLPKTDEERAKALADIRAKMEEAAKDQKGALMALDEAAIAKESQKILARAFAEEEKALQKAVQAAAPATKGAEPAKDATKGAPAPGPAAKGAEPAKAAPAAGASPKTQ